MKLDERGLNYIRKMQYAAERTKNLIDDLLALSLIGKGQDEYTNFDMNKLVANVLNVLGFNLKNSDVKDTLAYSDPNGKQIHIGKLPCVYGNSVQIRQVLQNLIMNGLKFQKNNELAVIHINAESENNRVIFSVRDNGIGIEERFLEKIFDIFQKLHTREIFEGTGIGLTFCKKIIERHGGQIWCESKIDIGSVFYFTLKQGKLI